MSNTEQRQYRPVAPSDLPKIQSGQLKAFAYFSDSHFPAKLVSVNGHNHSPIWVIKGPDYEWPRTSLYGMFVEVTPVKRYAIWNHKRQRFDSDIFHNYLDAQIACDSLQSKACYVIEWEIKNDA